MQHWQNTMCGHAAANILPVVASNRIGREKATASDIEMTFYGSSFIADRFDNRVEVADRVTQTVLTRRFDLDEIRAYRGSWGPFRDRRPDLYSALGTFDGRGRSLAETAQAL
ncbi:MAG: nitrilase-related carbon-nitrogen hydrolase [Gammaproteobacteria bacterium]|jgi:N-carbamoylputrescine amidase